MQTFIKLVVLVVILNVVRYVAVVPIEMATIMEPMHRVMPLYPEVFDSDFSSADFTRSLFYNFVMWFVAALVFHLMHPALRGPMLMKSLQAYWLMGLFFISLAAIYMNHYVHAVKPFYLWSMVDAAIAFTVVGVANAFLYPLFFRKR